MACLLTASVWAQPAPEAPAQALARDLQAKYRPRRRLLSRLRALYRGGVLKQQATERGRLLVKKPGKMRWEYTAPEKKLFVSDGLKIYSYIPQDRQVIVGTMPRDERRSNAGVVPDRQGQTSRATSPSPSKCRRSALGIDGPQADPEETGAGIRLADAGRRAANAESADADHGRCPGRAFGIHLLKSQGKRRTGR